MVFQSYAIWPHMTVFDNVAYGLRVRRESRAAIAEKVDRALDMVQMRAFSARGASQLSAASSSASRSRAPSCSSPRCCCSTSRCRTSTPSCAPTCASSCASCQHRLGITSVYVTHDLEEALAMSDRIVVMRDGLIEQVGSPDEIYNRRATRSWRTSSARRILIRGRKPHRSRDRRPGRAGNAGRPSRYGMAQAGPPAPS
jgi:iron(III) transport system ATP-binding protein